MDRDAGHVPQQPMSWSSIASFHPSSSSEMRDDASFPLNARMTLEPAQPGSSAGTTSQYPQPPAYNHLTPNARMESMNSRLPEISPNAASYSGLTWPQKVPQKPSYVWSSQYMAHGEATYAEEKREWESSGVPLNAGNRLLFEVWKQKYRASQRERPVVADGAQRATGIRAAIEAAAREGAARIRSNRQVAARYSRMAAFHAGERITEDSPDKGKSPLFPTKKEIQPLDHDHSLCWTWINAWDDDYEEVKAHAAANNLDLWPLTLQYMVEQLAMPEDECNDSENENEEYASAQENARDDVGPNGLSQSEELNGSDSDDYHTAKSDLGPPSEPHGYVRRSSESLTWYSDEEILRKRWDRISRSMLRAGLDKSPFIPHTFEQYLQLREDTTDVKKRRFQRQLKEREDEALLFQCTVEAGRPLPQLQLPVEFSEALKKISDRDGITTVTSRPSIWTASCASNTTIDWPSIREYKQEGDRREGAGYGRFLPLPRERELDDQYLHRAVGPDAIPSTGPGVPRVMRKVAGWAANGARYDGTTTHEAYELDQPAEEILVRELKDNTLDLMRQIEGSALADD